MRQHPTSHPPICGSGSRPARRSAVSYRRRWNATSSRIGCTARKSQQQVTCMSTRPSTHAGNEPLAPFPGEVREAVRAAASKKAANIAVLDLRQGGAFTDFFVICSGQNARQVKAIVDAIDE